MTETPSKPSRRRAPAMDADQRRAMIVAAALPLVVEYGASVTTAKIARAAGIGEGTIFRVFPDKDALLKACVAEAVRPDDTVRHLEAISLDQPLADRLTEAAEVIRGYLTRMGAVISALAATGRLEPPKPDEEGRLPDREAGLAAPRARWPPCSSPTRTGCGCPPNGWRTPSSSR
jgi:AcrR family transcriptional regulator